MKKFLELNNEMLTTYKSTGLIERGKDVEATRKFFLEEINNKVRHFLDLEEKIRYLTEEGYYEKEYLDLYEFEDIKKVFKLAYSYNFRFPSFMSASKFYESYAMKSRDGNEILEKYEDRVSIIALYLSQGDVELALKAVKAIMEAYQPATPTVMNSGKKARGELVSCFPYDTKVKTINGEVNIGEISVDDLVLTHNGHYKKVTGVKVSEFEGNLVQLDISGNNESLTSSTPEHPYLVYRPTVKQNENKINPIIEGDGDTDNLKWIKAEDILVGDYVAVDYDKFNNTDKVLDGYMLVKVKKVNYVHTNELVYNLEVKDDHTYTANGVIVHNCFKLKMDDSMNSISHHIGNSLDLSRKGGGVGLGLTDLRPLGDPIKGIVNRASGVMPVCKLLENSFSYANQLG